MSKKTSSHASLFDPVALGSLTLKNRIVMAPMTRLRATDALPNALMQEYYAQRASAGLIVTECTMVADTSAAYIGAPGIYDDRFVDPWRAITDAVHAAGGKIFVQLWHSGRIAHSSLMPGGEPPLAPSAISGDAELHTFEGKQHCSMPRAVTLPEIRDLVSAFGKAAERARAAGFDGVEIHGAFGYLIDQFLQDGSNHRTDQYGGTIENRMRFLRDIIVIVQQSFGSNVGVKLSPSSRAHGMTDSAPEQHFGFVLQRLNEMDLAYVHMMEPLPFDHQQGHSVGNVRSFARQHYKGTLIANGGFTGETAGDAITANEADLVSFGQSFIANPDLPARMMHDLPLTAPDFSTVYGIPGQPLERGYTDYPPAGSDHAAH